MATDLTKQQREDRKKDAMTDSNQTNQPAGSDREEVLKVHPNMETFCIYNHVCGVFARPDDEIPIGVGLTEPAAMFDARSRLPNGGREVER